MGFVVLCCLPLNAVSFLGRYFIACEACRFAVKLFVKAFEFLIIGESCCWWSIFCLYNYVRIIYKF